MNPLYKQSETYENITRKLEMYKNDNNAFAFKTDTLGSSYSHSLLILAKLTRSKNQVVHE